MPMTPAELAPVVENQPGLVAEALDAIYADFATPVSLDGLRTLAAASNGLVTTQSLLLATLLNHQTLGRFVAYLAVRGIDLTTRAGEQVFDTEFTDEFGPVVIGDVANDDFDFDRMSSFASRAKAFRCRIRVNGAAKGSGAFVSPRLVLTAAHVVEALTDAIAAGAPPPRLEIDASDGKTYGARLVWWQPCHPDEKAGNLPPPQAIASHCDAALLRVDRPLGRLVGRIDLPSQPAAWVGAGRFVLIHYPDGQARGISIGKIRRDGPDDLRQFHNVNTGGGSSGGPGFDRQFTFLGLHQGRWQAFRRIVPYERFAANPDFRREIESDRPPRYLWSLDGSLDSHIIIGRERFFEALTAMIEGTAPMLRGIWIKREDTSRTEGLSFSFHMLEAFLTAQEHPYEAYQIPTSYDAVDLIDQVTSIVFGDGEGVIAQPGVGRDETTAAAHDDDRTRRLADRLDARGAAEGRTIWIYFENPPSGLLQDTQIQLEHIVEEFVARPNVRLMMSGFETYDLLPQQFASVQEARRATRPGVLVDYLGNFRRSDVDVTAREMDHALALKWGDAVRQRMVDRALHGVPEVAPDTYAPSQLPTVAEGLRAEARKDYGTT